MEFICNLGVRVEKGIHGMKHGPLVSSSTVWRSLLTFVLLLVSGLTIVLPAFSADTNLALNKQVQALTNNAIGLPEYIVDGDYTTSWYSWQGTTAASVSFVLDLGAAYEIGSLTLQPLQTEGYFIESSLDGSSWTLRYTETDWLSWVDNRIRNITVATAFDARYLRYTGTNNQLAYVGLMEFEVYGVESSQVPFAGGDGTADNPWQISTVDQLANLHNYLGAENADKHFVLINNIDLNVAPHNEGEGWDPIGNYVGYLDPSNEPFTGTFDGGSYTITGLFINRPTTDGVGLFACTDGATISNLEVSGLDITGDLYVGGLVGYTEETTISNVSTAGVVLSSGGGRGGGLIGMGISSTSISHCSSSCSVDVTGSTNAGGLVGQFEESSVEYSSASGDVYCAQDLVGGLIGEARYNVTISNCFATGDVNGDGDVGGLVGGMNENSSISDSYAIGNVDGTGSWRVGGLVGGAENSSRTGEALIARSFAKGSVVGLNVVGGLAGQIGATVSVRNCYATGSSSGTAGVGGLIGYLRTDASVQNSYSTGIVNGASDAGGLVGTSEGVVTSSYYDTETTGMADIGKGEGLTTAAMKQQASFVDWEFPGVWKIAEAVTYPYLEWQELGTIDGIEVVTIPDDGSDIRGGYTVIYGVGEGDQTSVESHITGSTIEEISGEQVIVIYASPDGLVRAVVGTNSSGETRTWFERYDDQAGEWQEISATLPDLATFAPGSETVIEEGADGLQMRIQTTIVDEIQF